MSTSVLQMPSQTHPSYDAPDDGNRQIPELSSYNHAWMDQIRENQPSGSTFYSNFPPRTPIPPQAPIPHHEYHLQANSQQQTVEVNDLTFHGASFYGGPFHAPNQPYASVSGPDASGMITPTANYSSPSPFTPVNATTKTDETETISPLQTHFSDQFPAPFPRDGPVKTRYDSLANPEQVETSLQRTQPTIRRRRRSEYAEPGSARAIYLEKNRKAASKCRSKQKMEQEALVERAREVEQKNRVLRAEAELLKAELRAIKELVGQHANCPDRRMTQYLQREADRLAAAVMKPHQ